MANETKKPKPTYMGAPPSKKGPPTMAPASPKPKKQEPNWLRHVIGGDLTNALNNIPWKKAGEYVLGGGGAGQVVRGEAGSPADLFKRKGGSPSSGGATNPVVKGQTILDQSVLPEDVLMGRIDLSDFSTAEDNPYWIELQKTRPELARAITDKKNLDYQALLKKAQQGQSSVGNAVIDPMAVQLLFQNSINPFLSQVVQGANDQTANYGALMKQMTSDPNLPAPYRASLQAQAPQQVANMNQLTTALAGYTATQPSIQSLLHLLNSDYQAQQENIALQRLGQQQALTGQLFGLNQ